MHMFITDADIQDQRGSISEARILKHAKVMRLEVGENFLVQRKKGSDIHRYTCICTYMSKKEIQFDVVDVVSRSCIHTGSHIVVAIPLPNTLSKLDIIVQKLTEIGVHELVFRVADRSQIRSVSDKKMSKLCQISKEASEQAKNRYVPLIDFIEDLSIYIQKSDSHVYVLDQGGISVSSLLNPGSTHQNNILNKIVLLGPEGGLTSQDYDILAYEGSQYTAIDLGESILRMETASWIGAWIVKQLSIQ